jgi:hypothetical protein
MQAAVSAVEHDALSMIERKIDKLSRLIDSGVDCCKTT